jgi:hypothetical protein
VESASARKEIPGGAGSRSRRRRAPKLAAHLVEAPGTPLRDLQGDLGRDGMLDPLGGGDRLLLPVMPARRALSITNLPEWRLQHMSLAGRNYFL